MPAVSSTPPQPSLLPPLHSNSTDSCNSGHCDHSKTTATDVWYFLQALNTDLEPQVQPTNEPILECNPKTAFVGCKLCTYVLQSLRIVSHTLSLSNLNPECNGKLGNMAMAWHHVIESTPGKSIARSMRKQGEILYSTEIVGLCNLSHDYQCLLSK